MNLNSAPESLSPIAVIKPLCFSMIFFAIARPKPEPSYLSFGFNLSNNEKIESTYLDSKPIPLSFILMITNFPLGLDSALNDFVFTRLELMCICGLRS